LPKGTLQEEWALNVYGTGNSIESIFEIQFSLEKRNPFWNMFARAAKEFQAKSWIVEGGLYGVDLIDPENRDIRGNGTSYNEATGSITKFTLGKTDATSTSNW